LTIRFQNQSVGAETTLWDFGDGQTSTQTSPTHVYRKNGRFTVTLTITGASGTDKFSQPGAVLVTRPPNATLSGSSSRIQRTSLVAFQYQTDGDVSSRSITFGDGASQPLRSGSGRIEHRYQRVGTFTARMTVRGKSGKVVTRQHRVVVDPRKKVVPLKPRQFGRLHPRKVRGDCDFKGHGPNVHARARLFVSTRDLKVQFYMQAAETKKDWSTARADWTYPLFRAPAGWRISRVVTPAVAVGKNFTDEWKFTAKGHGYFRRSGKYFHFTVRGDTKGDDICGRTSDDTHMIVLARNLSVEIVEDLQPVKRVKQVDAVIRRR
jgi:hypothetical protein